MKTIQIPDFYIGEIVLDEYNRKCKILKIFEDKIIYEFLNELKPDGSKNYSIITCNSNLIKNINENNFNI